jgi:serine protease
VNQQYTAAGGQVPRPRRLLGQAPEPPLPHPRTLAQHGAHLLTPINAVRGSDAPVQPTAYTADHLIMPAGKAGEQALELVRRVAAEHALDVVSQECSLRCKGGTKLDAEDERIVAAYKLVPNGKKAVSPDAWALLQAVRLTGEAAAEGVSLDHLMFGPGLGGAAPHTSGFSTGDQGGLASYGQVGGGGRQVVSWVGAVPQRQCMEPEKRPRVAILDTGCGDHPWLKQGVIRLRVDDDPGEDPEKYGDQDSPLLGELDSHSGHGTFIAGIIRQGCPDADLLTIRVMKSDGVVREWETLHVLQSLWEQTKRWVEGDDKATHVDVVVLSLGYYHETPVDPGYTFLMREVLASLGKLGVIVVVAAGNDATTRPFYPAALAPLQDEVTGADCNAVPVISVGSLNPDGKTIALFNNAGPWIREWRPGVSLVSTVPTDLKGALQPRIELPTPLEGEADVRATIDDDDFSGGFAVWSGTSFAAPVLAAEVAKQLIAGKMLGKQGKDEGLERGWHAVEATTKIHRGART